MKRSALIVLVAFAAGVGVGVFVDEMVPIASEEVRDSASDAVETAASTDGSAHVDAKVPIASEEVRDSASDAVETTVSEAVVEVMTDNSPVPSQEISAAHAARQARRAAARAAKEGSRRDFLSSLNFDLLTDSQRKTHELFVEAQKVRDEVAAEVRRLRAAGEDVPIELQSRLAAAQSVLRAGRDAECRALREAAARAAGLDENGVRQLLDDLNSIEAVFR